MTLQLWIAVTCGLIMVLIVLCNEWVVRRDPMSESEVDIAESKRLRRNRVVDCDLDGRRKW